MNIHIIGIEHLYIVHGIAEFNTRGGDYKNLYFLYCSRDEFSTRMLFSDSEPYYSFKYQLPNTRPYHSFFVHRESIMQVHTIMVNGLTQNMITW